MKENDLYFWFGYWMDGSVMSELRWEILVEEQVWGDEFYLGYVERVVGFCVQSGYEDRFELEMWIWGIGGRGGDWRLWEWLRKFREYVANLEQDLMEF